MKQALINAYRELVEEASTLSGEEWRENRQRRKRMAVRALEQYGASIHLLAFGK